MPSDQLLIGFREKYRFVKTIIASEVAILSIAACSGAENAPSVKFVERSKVFGANSGSVSADPLRLIVEIDESGRLTLNRIEVGNINDPKSVTNELRLIFGDRALSRVETREVIVATKGWIDHDLLEKLIDRLRKSNAGPIVIVNSMN